MEKRDMGYHHRYKPRDFDFAQLLVTLRRRACLTQKDVALWVGAAEKSVRNWEGGSNYPSELNLRKLIELYLDKHVFAPGLEQDEAHTLWEQLRNSSPRRIGLFDEQWFATLSQQWQAHKQEESQPQALPQSPELHPLTIPETTTQNAFPPRLSRRDWSEMIDVTVWYGRTDEMAELEHWLLKDQCRLVAVLGMGGIGKTALATKFVQQVAPQFELVLWRSLHNAPPLEELLRDWLSALTEPHGTYSHQDVDQSLAFLIELLQKRRCLLILDNLETLFQEEVLEGRYREGYEGYAKLIRSIAQTAHHSCLFLTCREMFPDLGTFAGLQTPVRVFRLGGLALSASQQMLQDKGLFGDHDAWSNLVQQYAGNPLALKIVAETIRELFGGDIATFLTEGLLMFHGIRQLLAQHFERLSALEQALMYWLAIERELITLETLRKDLRHPVSKSEVMEAMHSLRGRSLMERGERGAVFLLQPVVLEYVTERLVMLISEEILQGKPVLLLQYALLQASAKDYIRTSQAHLIVQPVLDRLISHLGNSQRLEEQLELLLQQLRTMPYAEQGYGGGNVVNLLVRLNGHVKGKDCSRLTIWQANLQEAEVQDATFAQSDLTGSVFTETMNSIMSVALSANGQYLAGGSNTGEIRIWQVGSGQPLQAIQSDTWVIWSLAFNPESTLLVSGGYDGLIKVWEVSSGQCLCTLEGHTRWVRSVVFHPEGKMLMTCSQDGSIRFWDLAEGRCIKVWYEQHCELWSVACSPDGLLLACSQRDGTIKVWDIASEQCLWSITAHKGLPVPSIAFSPDSTLLVSGGEDGTIVVWEANSGEHLSTLSGHTNKIFSVTFNGEGLLASGSHDRTVKLWKIRREAAQCLCTLQGHANWIWSTAFGPEGLLASGSHDGVVKLWQIGRGNEGGKCLRTLSGYSRQIHSVALSYDGKISS